MGDKNPKKVPKKKQVAEKKPVQAPSAGATNAVKKSAK